MSSNDKTRNKLMETMRMTKADPGKKAESGDTKQAIAPQDDKPIKKKEKKTAAKKASKGSQKSSVDPYQTTRRVWPD